MARPARAGRLLAAARRWKRVRFSIFLCFFLRMRLRRFLISEPMAAGTYRPIGEPVRTEPAGGPAGVRKLGGEDSNP